VKVIKIIIVTIMITIASVVAQAIIKHADKLSSKTFYTINITN